MRETTVCEPFDERDNMLQTLRERQQVTSPSRRVTTGYESEINWDRARSTILAAAQRVSDALFCRRASCFARLRSVSACTTGADET